jgi:DNA-binding transcriptional ArsR family regulator
MAALTMRHRLCENDAAVAWMTMMLRAISNKNRLIMLLLLQDGELSVGELAEQIGLSQSACSQHLALLKVHGLVQARPEGQKRHYSLVMGPVEPVIDLLERISRNSPDSGWHGNQGH